jgi:hypothetical protein
MRLKRVPSCPFVSLLYHPDLREEHLTGEANVLTSLSGPSVFISSQAFRTLFLQE